MIDSLSVELKSLLRNSSWLFQITYSWNGPIRLSLCIIDTFVDRNSVSTYSKTGMPAKSIKSSCPIDMFMFWYGEYDVSVDRHHYHARNLSTEDLLKYLYRLNVAAVREKISIQEEAPAFRRAHVKHFIEI